MGMTGLDVNGELGYDGFAKSYSLERRDAVLDESIGTGMPLVVGEFGVVVFGDLSFVVNLPCESRRRFLLVNCASVSLLLLCLSYPVLSRSS